MDDFGINEMLEMQKTLQEKYKDIWETISPEIGQNKLLWMIGEIGEVIDIIKKNGGTIETSDLEQRKHLVEEMADVSIMIQQFLSLNTAPVDIYKQIISQKLERQLERIAAEREKE